MSRILLFLFAVSLFASCGAPNQRMLARQKRTAKQGPPSGKARNPRQISFTNPFQGSAKSRLSKSKKKKFKLYKRKRKQAGTFRAGKKPGRSFGRKRTISRGRLKSSGSRVKSGGGSKKRNKNLFNTRKK